MKRKTIETTQNIVKKHIFILGLGFVRISVFIWKNGIPHCELFLRAISPREFAKNSDIGGPNCQKHVTGIKQLFKGLITNHSINGDDKFSKCVQLKC